MGGTETVKEVDKGNAALEGGQMCNSTQVHNFLLVGLTQHGETGLTAGVYVGVVTENVQRVGGHGSCGNVENSGQQFAGDLIHIGDHQQKALRGSVGGGQRTGGQRAVDGTSSTSFGLHFNDLNGVAEDVLPTSSGPLIHVVCHGAGGSDGIDAGYFSKRIADMCGGGIAVHCKFLSCQIKYLLKYFNSTLTILPRGA